jgi:hypothetical protein
MAEIVNNRVSMRRYRQILPDLTQPASRQYRDWSLDEHHEYRPSLSRAQMADIRAAPEAYQRYQDNQFACSPVFPDPNEPNSVHSPAKPARLRVIWEKPCKPPRKQAPSGKRYHNADPNLSWYLNRFR